jgi:hypothetical protein
VETNSRITRAGTIVMFGSEMNGLQDTSNHHPETLIFYAEHRNCHDKNRYFTQTMMSCAAISVLKRESKDRFTEACNNYKTRE